MKWFILICCIVSLHAQEELEYYYTLSLEELMNIEITSASKQSESLNEIPASVVIVTRNDIEKYGYTTITDVLRNVPGFYHMNNYAQDIFGVRGVMGGEIVLLVNGVIQRHTALKNFAFNAEIIDRIEIIRGPMSVIYGNGAFLGSINIITNEMNPNYKPLNMMSAGIGTNDTYKAFARASAKEGDLHTVFTLSLYDTQGIDAEYSDMFSQEQFENIPDGAHTSSKNDLERSNINIMLSAEYKNFYTQLQINNNINEWYLITPSFDEGNQEESKTTVSVLGYKNSLSEDFSYDAKFTYSTFEELRKYDFISKELVGERRTSGNTLDVELNLFYNPSETFNAIIGANRVNTYNTSRNLNVPLLGANRFIASSDVITNSIFSQVSYTPMQNVQIVAGVRFEQDQPYSNTITDCEGDVCSSVQDSISDDKKIYFIPRLALIYSYNPHHVLKLLYGHATRNDLLLSTVSSKRETIETYELNYIYTQSNFMISSSFFRNDINNLARGFQIFNSDTGEVDTFFDDSGELVTHGVELITQLKFQSGLSFDLSGTYVNVEDTKNEIDPGYVPELLFKFKTAWEYNEYIFALNATYTDSMKADWNAILEDGSANRIGDEVASNFLVDANVRYVHSSDFYANFHISNLLDEEVRYPASSDTPFEQGLIGQGRGVLLTLGQKF